ncbi:MAG: 2-phospho-L-lactate transferase CofD family protein, partial [Thaumarchaeota archaeon]|nr:2-phospho-L-lactate transferase CofD family protein [Nitrososphaerota archaeon]
MKGKLGVICGGSGSSKLAGAVARYPPELDREKIRFVANVADNFWYHGLFVCPDVDIVTFALSNLLDQSKGWGLQTDTLVSRRQISDLGISEEWFSLGDKDFAFSIKRAELLKKGWTLSSVTNYFCKAVKTAFSVVPATDDFLQSFIRTAQGLMHLQEYWVKKRAGLEPLGINYVGLSTAILTTTAAEACSNNVLICPGNPMTSILPIVNLRGFRKKLSCSKVIGISPFLGDKPFSGPAARLMKAEKIEPNSFGVAKLYSDFLKI